MGALFGHLATSPAASRFGSAVSRNELLSVPHRVGSQIMFTDGGR
jgi:hypothetical protein